MTDQTGPFSKGDAVPKEGAYVCVPCGFKKDYKSGEHFEECISCFSGTPQGEHEEFVDGMEMWEPVTEPAKQT
jgi:hypothetical protein